MTPNLLLVPSARKSGKLYSVLPVDGSGDLTFARASTAVEMNGSGLLSSVATGVPRLDYTDSSCPKLLLEPARTNLLTYSQDFSNAAWQKTNVTIAPNAVIAPDGTMTADLVTSTGTGIIVQFNKWSTTKSVGGVFAKAGSSSRFSIDNASEVGNGVIFDLSDGTIESEQSGFTGFIENYGNGWYRISAAHTAAASGTFAIQLLGGSGETGYIWGAQFEQGSYPSSYIPTTSATVTRVADSASLYGLKAAGLIGATEGSIGGEFYGTYLTSDSTGRNLKLGDESIDGFSLYRSGSARIIFLLRKNSNTVQNYITTQDYNKWLFAWDSNGWFLSVNGTTVASGSEVFTFSSDYLIMSGAGGKWKLGQLYSYTTKLTESEATEYTSYNTYEEMAMLLGYTID